MEQLSKEYEFIFIDDGSTDHTLEKLIQLKNGHPAIRVLQLPTKKGLSTALKIGIEASRGNVIITIDADLQNDPADILKLYPYLQTNDLVMGWRKERKDPVLKKFSSTIANWIRNRLTDEEIPDCTCTLKIFKKECFQTIQFYNGMHRFIPTLFKLKGYKVMQIPINHRPRLTGKSKYGIWNRLLPSLIDCLVVRWMIHKTIDEKAIEL